MKSRKRSGVYSTPGEESLTLKVEEDSRALHEMFSQEGEEGTVGEGRRHCFFKDEKRRNICPLAVYLAPCPSTELLKYIPWTTLLLLSPVRGTESSSMGNNPSIYEPDLRAEFDARRKERGFDYLVRLDTIAQRSSIGSLAGSICPH